MSDATAEALGGREHVEQMYERIGDGGHIVIHSPADSEEQIALLFNMAKTFSGADPFLIDENDVRRAIIRAHSADSPSFRSTDLDGDGSFDIGSYRYLPEYFEPDLLHFPGSKEQVRDFITAHELGHRSHAGGTGFWDVWQSETDADQDAFLGMGDSATTEFQRGILATRAGDVLSLVLYKEIMNNRNSRSFGEDPYVQNEAYKHASVLGTFLPGETPYEITEAGLNASLTDFTAKITERMRDNHIAENPDFEIDISAISESADMQQSAASLNSFVEGKGFLIASMYGQFMENIEDLEKQLGSLDFLRQMTLGSEAMADFRDSAENEIYDQMQTEYQQALTFMRDTSPEMFQEYILANHPDAMVRQTDFRGDDFDMIRDRTRMAEIVLQLRDEGAFDDDPVQKRLADYIEIDMGIRPHRYAAPEETAPQSNQSANRELTIEATATRTPS